MNPPISPMLSSNKPQEEKDTMFARISQIDGKFEVKIYSSTRVYESATFKGLEEAAIFASGKSQKVIFKID